MRYDKLQTVYCDTPLTASVETKNTKKCKMNPFKKNSDGVDIPNNTLYTWAKHINRIWIVTTTPKAAYAIASAASPKYAAGRKSGACFRIASR